MSLSAKAAVIRRSSLNASIELIINVLDRRDENRRSGDSKNALQVLRSLIEIALTHSFYPKVGKAPKRALISTRFSHCDN